MQDPPKGRPRHVVPGPRPGERHRLGEEALHFTRWFAQSKYRLMDGFLGEIETAHEEDRASLRSRFDRALKHAERVHRARGIVTILLAAGIIATAASALAGYFDGNVVFELLQRLAAVATSITLVLVALRLAFDRYLERVDVAATFLAIEIAVARKET